MTEQARGRLPRRAVAVGLIALPLATLPATPARAAERTRREVLEAFRHHGGYPVSIRTAAIRLDCAITEADSLRIREGIPCYAEEMVKIFRSREPWNA